MKKSMRALGFFLGIIILSQANAWPLDKLTLDDVKELQGQGVLLAAYYSENQTMKSFNENVTPLRVNQKFEFKDQQGTGYNGAIFVDDEKLHRKLLVEVMEIYNIEQIPLTESSWGYSYQVNKWKENELISYIIYLNLYFEE